MKMWNLLKCQKEMIDRPITNIRLSRCLPVKSLLGLKQTYNAQAIADTIDGSS